MNIHEFSRVFESVKRWAERSGTVVALGLAGSWARGNARADSDIDFVILTEDPSLFRENAEWLDEIAWQETGLVLLRWNDEDWGNIWCRRAYFEPSAEIEFNFGTPAWASIKPPAEGARRIVIDGFKIAVDKQGILSAFIGTLSRSRHNMAQGD